MSDELHAKRMAELAADPKRCHYLERMSRGERWSDAQIDYNPDRLQRRSGVDGNVRASVFDRAGDAICGNRAKADRVFSRRAIGLVAIGLCGLQD